VGQKRPSTAGCNYSLAPLQSTPSIIVYQLILLKASFQIQIMQEPKVFSAYDH